MALGRLARARELLGQKTPPPLWFWAAALAHAGAEDGDDALTTARAGVAAHPASAVLRNNLAVLLEASGDLAGRRSGAARRARRGPVAAADLEEPRRPLLPRGPVRRRVRGVRARRQARSRAGRRPLLQARQPRVQARRPRPRAGELGAGHRAEPGPPARARQPRHARPHRVTTDQAGFEALTAGDLAHRGDLARYLQGEVPPAAHRRAHAGVRRAHLRRVPGGARPHARRVRASEGRAHDQRDAVLPERRDVAAARRGLSARAAARACRARIRVWSAGCSSGEEAYGLAILVADAAVAGATARGLERVHVDATDIDRRSLERATEGRYRAEALSETAARHPRAVLRGRAARAGVSRQGAPPGPRAAARPRPRAAAGHAFI